MAQNQTVVEVLNKVSETYPTRNLFTFLDEQGQAVEALTAHQLYTEATMLGNYLLQDRRINPGDVVLLVYLPSLDFVKAFTACLLSGIIPAPLAAPTTLTARDVLALLSTTAAHSRSVAVLSHDEFLKTVAYDPDTCRIADENYPDLAWYSTNISLDREFTPLVCRPKLDDLAFLQYTSGSTSLPKGVMITHGNLVHQIQTGAEIGSLSPETRTVTWLPHHHDFCLIWGICAALYGNGHLFLMSPLTYLFNPGVWFDVLSLVRATNTAAPDFGYRYAVANTTPEQRRKWNLSSLKMAMSAAEPIYLSTVQNFIEAFTPAQFNPTAFCPSYGLAEHTGGVTTFGRIYLNLNRQALEQRSIVPLEEASPDTVTVIGCGRAMEGVDIRIVDSETCQECTADQVGEIWLDSPSKGEGYYGLPELSQDVFYAQIQGDSSGRQYLRTGDLGFVFENELFVTGRLKDLIIFRGHNFYPHDIEAKVQYAHTDIRDGGVVAFQYSPLDDKEHQIGLIVEAQRNYVSPDTLQTVAKAIRKVISSEFRLPCYVVAIVAPGTVLRTTSGKLKRQATASAYLTGNLSSKILLEHCL